MREDHYKKALRELKEAIERYGGRPGGLKRRAGPREYPLPKTYQFVSRGSERWER